MNNNIFIAGGEEHLSLFRNELPGLSFIKFPGFKPGYSRFLPQYISLLLKTPVLLYHIIREHYRLKRIIHDYDINIVISDNRFGLWNRKIKTVYVTHMPRIPLPKTLRSLEFIGIMLHRAILKKYSLCFIPDLPGELNVSGRLSHGLNLPDNVRYIGILSRFISDKPSLHEHGAKHKYNTVILSGPEPQRGILKKKMVDIFKDKETMTVILEGKPGNKTEIVKSGNITFYNHLSSSEMRDVLTSSEKIITRSGYTTIMELISLNYSALLIPTPGQTEQEYLADYLSERGWFSSVKQNELKAGIQIPLKEYICSDEIIKQSRIYLKKALKELLEEPHI
ncbi:MAG TPA: glycosyltransferase [Bacteroidales bacterium]|nr:glycosyltransferase [Bacteroidales bacterium]